MLGITERGESNMTHNMNVLYYIHRGMRYYKVFNNTIRELNNRYRKIRQYSFGEIRITLFKMNNY